MTSARPDRYEPRTEIARRRQEQGLSQEELSAIADSTTSTLYAWRRASPRTRLAHDGVVGR